VQSGRTSISLLHLARQKGAHVSIRYLSLLGFALVTTVYDLFIISLTCHRYHQLQSMDSCKLFTISSPRSLLHFPLAVCVITHCILLSQCHSLNCCVTKRTDRLVFRDATRNAYLADRYKILFMGEMELHRRCIKHKAYILLLYKVVKQYESLPDRRLLKY